LNPIRRTARPQTNRDEGGPHHRSGPRRYPTRGRPRD